MKKLIVAITTAVMLLTAMGSALANPNKAGNSGHFHPKSNPCSSNQNHPNCPGPH
jgi:hypothetical protein